MESCERKPNLVNSEAVAEYFAVGVGTVNRWVRLGRIPCIRPARNVVRFNLADVERAVSINAVPVTK